MMKRMKKGLSPMIATVLLIGFTVAVGAILSVWFTTFTKTQTSGVAGIGACAINPVDIEAMDLSNGVLTYRVINRGIHPINFTNAIFSCDTGSWMNTSFSVLLQGNSMEFLKENTTQGAGNPCTDRLKVEIILYGYCTDIPGSTKEVRCPAGGCFG